jgi:hypothetical protein
MKPELELTKDELQLMEAKLHDLRWKRVFNDVWIHPGSFIGVKTCTAAKIAGVYPGVKIDSLHPFLKQIQKHTHDKAAMDGADEERRSSADPIRD